MTVVLRSILLCAVISLSLCGAASAGLPRAVLDSLGVRPPPGARLDLGMTAPDAQGRVRSLRAILAGKPAFLNFVDYTCNTLCGTDLMLLTDGIRRAGLKPDDLRILAVGIDPKDNAVAAIKMEDAEIPADLRASTAFLLPNVAMVTQATRALGFHYAYDPAIDQFAHPAIVYALAPDGRVRGLLSPLSLTADDLRQDLAGPPPRPLGLYGRLHTLCYAYDPQTGKYSLRIAFILRLTGLLTLILMATGIAALIWRRRRA
jgi:protein SCO1/2